MTATPWTSAAPTEAEMRRRERAASEAMDITKCKGQPVRSIYWCESCDSDFLVNYHRRCGTKGNEWAGVVDVDRDGRPLTPLRRGASAPTAQGGG